jgi:hypothetical protein
MVEDFVVKTGLLMVVYKFLTVKIIPENGRKASGQQGKKQQLYHIQSG